MAEIRTSRQLWLCPAAFESSLRLPSPFNPGAGAGGFIGVTHGDRLPQIPLNSAKVDLRCHITPAWSADFEAVVASNVYLEGDQANLQKPVPGYVVFNAETEYELTPHDQFYVQLQNLTNNKYATFGIFGDPTGRGAFPQFTNPRFVTPASPFGFWIGIRTQL
jgi:outer membrane receptor protein involved in Fe transport